ncbi:Putative conserved plasma membrane protein [Gryllus bimaculatus]|nr:Putative conserved plasma membrane protein [Gryllus bimaculatus]
MAQHIQKILSSSSLSPFYSECTVGLKYIRWQETLKTPFGRGSPALVATATIHNYMIAKQLPLPENIEDIAAAEKAQFSPQRSRDISGPVILSKTMGTFINNEFATGYNSCSQPSDPRLSSYDCRGLVSLHSVMQTNVPEPFSAKGKATHLNMPGGQWGQGYKYISDDLQNFHYRNMSQQGSSGTYFKRQKFPSVVLMGKQFHLQRYAPYSTSVDNNNSNVLTNKEKLKRALKEYGSTVIVFHVGISLLSLGGCYLAVSSGVDVNAIFRSWGVHEVAADASTFIVAYAIHKVFAPVRIGITLTCTPLIVSYLRKVGFLRPPKKT